MKTHPTSFHRLADAYRFSVAYAARIVAEDQRPAHSFHTGAAMALAEEGRADARLMRQAAFIAKLDTRFPYRPEVGPVAPLP